VRESSEKKKVSTKPRRVVVTGMGVVSCLGHDPDSFYSNLLAGNSGVTGIENFDCRDFPTVSFS
jgi:3-oxoacyl-[acyl-carrier-protein] synthase II